MKAMNAVIRCAAAGSLLVVLCAFDSCESDDKTGPATPFTVGWDCQVRGDAGQDLACSAAITGLDLAELKTCSWDASFANPHVSTSSGLSCSHVFRYDDECAAGDQLGVTARLSVTSGASMYGPEPKDYVVCDP